MQLTTCPLLCAALLCAVFANAQTPQSGPMATAETLSVLGPFEGALDRVRDLSVLRLSDPAGPRMSYRLVPGEVARELPGAAYRDGQFDRIDYEALTATLIASVQELHRATAALQREVAHLLREKADLERTVDALDAQSAELDRGLRAVRGVPGSVSVTAGAN